MAHNKYDIIYILSKTSSDFEFANLRNTVHAFTQRSYAASRDNINYLHISEQATAKTFEIIPGLALILIGCGVV